MNLERERELFLKSKLIKGIKFETLEHYMDGNLVIFIDKILNFMWHSWLASASREGYKLVPVEPNQKMIEAASIEKFVESECKDVEAYKAGLRAYGRIEALHWVLENNDENIRELS